jgi:hypothetical protein
MEDSTPEDCSTDTTLVACTAGVVDSINVEDTSTGVEASDVATTGIVTAGAVV